MTGLINFMFNYYSIDQANRQDKADERNKPYLLTLMNFNSVIYYI